MRTKIITIGIMSMLLLTSLSVYSAIGIQVDENNTEKIKQSITNCNCIHSKNQKDENSRSCGELSTSKTGEQMPNSEYIPQGDLPSSFNWRDALLDENGQGIPGNGAGYDWTTPVKYQGWCGSCYDFTLQGVFESVISIGERDPTMDLDLSEQYMLSCSQGSCNGWYWDRAVSWMENHGAIPEECFPYQADDSIPCSDKCSDWENQNIPVKDYGKITGELDDKKSVLIEKGPLLTRMEVYDDFMWDYEDGVYVHEGDVPNVDSYHTVVIIGYEDTPNNPDYDGYWICKNSWGTSWGDDGWFKIAYYKDGKYRSNYRTTIYSEAYIGYFVAWLEYEAGSIPSFIVDAQIDVKWCESPHTPISFRGVAAGGTPQYNWHWDFGDEHESNNRNPTHTYEKSGYYTVTLTVTDSNGDKCSDTDEILIDTPPNKPMIKGPNQGKAGIEYVYNISAVDPDNDDIKIIVDWDDGPAETTNFLQSGETIQLSHTFSGSYTYTIYAQAVDEYNVPSDWGTLEVTMPKSKPYVNTPFLNFLQNHPLIYQLLQRFLRL